MKLASLFITVFPLILLTHMGFTTPALAAKVFDPVCEIKVEENDDTTIHAEYDGKHYYFCSEECFNKFQNAPDEYACVCPPGSKDCAHCQGTAARCPCSLEKHKGGHEEHEHHPGHEH